MPAVLNKSVCVLYVTEGLAGSVQLPCSKRRRGIQDYIDVFGPGQEKCVKEGDLLRHFPDASVAIEGYVLMEIKFPAYDVEGPLR